METKSNLQKAVDYLVANPEGFQKKHNALRRMASGNMSHLMGLKNALFFCFLLMASTEIIAQEEKSTGYGDFKIVLEKTENGIKMQGLEGSAWVDLSFDLNDDLSQQAVDEYGMADLNRISAHKDPKIADFLITVAKSENGLVLKGMEGTAWTDLRFSLPENGKKAIDQFGMTEVF